MARRIFAGAFLVAVMSLSLAGIAGAQDPSASPSPSPSTTTTTEPTTTTIKTAGATTARTGTNLAIPLIGGGILIIAALGMRRLRTL
jgi:hypothetical protein